MYQLHLLNNYKKVILSLVCHENYSIMLIFAVTDEQENLKVLSSVFIIWGKYSNNFRKSRFDLKMPCIGW